MKFTNELNLPQPLVDAVTNDPYDSGDCDISATGLINAPRRRQLLIKYDDQITEDVADRLWALFGQVGHGILERAAIDDGTRVIEKRFFAEVDGWKISGQLDLLQFEKKGVGSHGEPKKEQRLRFLEKGIMADYKIMSAWEILFGLKEEKVAQQNILAWLCKKNGLGVKKLTIVALLRDWSRPKAMSNPDYPKRNIVVMTLPFWSMEKTEAYIRERIRLHKDAEHELPLCTPDERWHKDDKFAVMKKDRKSALRVLNSKENAEFYIETAIENKPVLKNKLSIEVRVGEDTRCEFYCAAAQFCTQFQNTLK